MSDKLPPLAEQAPGQTRIRFNLNTGEQWHSPNRVREYIAEAKREMLDTKPMVALVDGQIRDCLDAIDPATRRLPPGMLAFARAVIAKFCRLNGLAEPVHHTTKGE